MHLAMRRREGDRVRAAMRKTSRLRLVPWRAPVGDALRGDWRSVMRGGRSVANEILPGDMRRIVWNGKVPMGNVRCGAAPGMA
jgi:hypothetical protein